MIEFYWDQILVVSNQMKSILRVLAEELPHNSWNKPDNDQRFRLLPSQFPPWMPGLLAASVSACICRVSCRRHAGTQGIELPICEQGADTSNCVPANIKTDGKGGGEKQKRDVMITYLDGILPKGPCPPCLRMADRALSAGYPWSMG